MKEIPDDLMYFLERQSFVIVSTIDQDSRIHCSAKGIVGIDKEGRIYLFDLYKRATYRNIQANPTMSITAVNEREFEGCSLKGKAAIVKRDEVEDHIMKKWEKRIVRRISERLIKNVQEDKQSAHPEAHLPPPQYLIVMEVFDIVDLTPAHIRAHLS